MGNASAVDSGSWFSLISGTEDVAVNLRLVDYRNLTLPAGLDLTAYVPYGSDGRVARCQRGGSPASFQVRPNTPVVIEFHATRGVCERQKVSEVRLRLDHLAARCGRGLYRTWLPLTVPQSRGDDAEDSLAVFDKAVSVCGKDVKCPMVCLSLGQEYSTDAADGEYTRAASPADKAERFDGLLVSHMQHVRMVMSMYHITRQEQTIRKGNRHRLGGDDARMVPDGFGLRSKVDVYEDDPIGNSKSSWAHSDFSDERSSEDLRRLQQEVDATTEDANRRINEVSSKIRTLKDKVSKQELENANLRRQTADMNEEAEALELENERLALALERRAKAGLHSEDRSSELEAMRRDVAILRDQKESLVLILEDLYSSAAKTDSGSAHGQQAPPSSSGAAPSMGTRAVDDQADPLSATTPLTLATTGPGNKSKEEGWTQLLPRPSELFSNDRFD
mmetsp:Transcript_57783/g.137564  ORF Transcript_57783/g.137564 Transcript_57783/m.137564 type:complete len:448 (-) Transcript_57783:151-1494(-)